jgi:uncharacterized repeat protein (TIGR02543 family)
MRKVLSVFIGVCLVLSLLTGVFAPVPKALAETDGDYIYTVSEGKATITGYTGLGDIVVIPGTLGGYPVTMIGTSAFQNAQGNLLASVTIPNGVTMILGSAFRGCTGLTTVTIPNGLTRISNAAFMDCTSLTGLVIPNSVTNIDANAFQGCTALTNLTIGSGLKSIQYAVFSGCTALTSVTIPSSVTSIGTHAFYQCTALSSVTIGVGVTTIGANAFKSCKALTSVTIPNSVTSIGANAFQSCTALVSVTIPEGVRSIEDYAFYSCSALTSLVIPDSVESIGYWAFRSCAALASVTIGRGVTTIAAGAFDWCMKLATAYFLGNAPTMGAGVFESCAAGFAVRYVSGTTGWTNPWYTYPASAFSGATYTLTTTSSPPAGGSIGWSPVAASYTPGTVLTLTATPAAGYTFAGWSGGVTGTANPETITMDGNKTVTATFTVVPTYTLTPTAGTGGTMTPNTAQAVLQGGSATFSIAANTGYRIADVTVDGASQGNISSYTFTNVTSNHTIKAAFEKEQEQTVIVLQIGKSTFTVNGSSKTLDSPPVIKNSRTLVPIRAVIEALGGTVGWDGTARKVTVTLGATSLNLWIGKSVATVNGTNTAIDATNAKVVPEIINSRTMLPLRFVSENLGCSVLWEDATKTITITYGS